MATSASTGYPTGATPTSTVAAAASTTGAASVLSTYLYDNSEIDVTKVFRGRNSLFSVLTNLGRANGGSYDTLGTYEKMSNNYPEYTWQNKGEDGYSFTLNGAINTTDATLTFVSTAGMFAGMRIQNTATNEVMTVKSITNSTTAVVVRGATGVASVASSDAFLEVGTAVGVGVASTTFVGAANSSLTNYFQHFVTTVTITDKDMMAAKVGGDKKAQIESILADKMLTHADQIERGVLFGQKQTFTDATLGTVYTMDGIKEFAIRGWTADISSGLTAETLENALAYPLRYTKEGSTVKILLCGSKVKSKISALFYSGQVRTENIKEIDLTVEKVVMNGGEYILLQHPFMDDASGAWSKCAIVLDPGYTEIVYPQGVDIEKKGFNGKTALIYNTSASTYAQQTLDISTYLSVAVTNVNACGALRLVA